MGSGLNRFKSTQPLYHQKKIQQLCLVIQADIYKRQKTMCCSVLLASRPINSSRLASEDIAYQMQSYNIPERYFLNADDDEGNLAPCEKRTSTSRGNVKVVAIQVICHIGPSSTLLSFPYLDCLYLGLIKWKNL